MKGNYQLGYNKGQTLAKMRAYNLGHTDGYKGNVNKPDKVDFKWEAIYRKGYKDGEGQFRNEGYERARNLAAGDAELGNSTTWGIASHLKEDGVKEYLRRIPGFSKVYSETLRREVAVNKGYAFSLAWDNTQRRKTTNTDRPFVVSDMLGYNKYLQDDYKLGYDSFIIALGDYLRKQTALPPRKHKYFGNEQQGSLSYFLDEAKRKILNHRYPEFLQRRENRQSSREREESSLPTNSPDAAPKQTQKPKGVSIF